jgi:hypothetical protein
MDAFGGIERGQMDAYMEELKQQVRVYFDKVPESMGKCRTLKGTLDSTLGEHDHHKKS